MYNQEKKELLLLLNCRSYRFLSNKTYTAWLYSYN
jgi:hypothetical protein